MIKLKHFRQTPAFCGPASLKMVLNFYGVSVSEEDLVKLSGATPKKGTSLKGLIKAAKHYKFHTYSKTNGTLVDLKRFVKKGIPIIVDWFSEDDGHYSVVVDIDKNSIILMDPEKGHYKMTLEKFERVWFDFPGDFIKSPKDIILRLFLVVAPFKI